MRSSVSTRPIYVVALLALAWGGTVVAATAAAWGLFPRGGYQPPVTGFLQAIGQAVASMWPALFAGLVSLAELVLFPLTWLALEAPYRKTIPSAFIFSVAAFVAANSERLLATVSPFALVVMYGILAAEGLRATVTYLVHRLYSEAEVLRADA